MNFLNEIFKDTEREVCDFIDHKKFGKVRIEINFKDGKYMCDDINNVVTKRINNKINVKAKSIKTL